MGYRITYENGIARKEMLKADKRKWKPWGIGLAVLSLGVTLMAPKGRIWARDLLLPGDEEVTAAALEGIISDLREGESMGTALEAFCQEILAGA